MDSKLQTTKQGDTVIRRDMYGHRTEEKVARTTKTMIVLTTGERFNRNGLITNMKDLRMDQAVYIFGI